MPFNGTHSPNAESSHAMRRSYTSDVHNSPHTPLAASTAQLGNRSTSHGSRKRPRPESPNSSKAQPKDRSDRWGPCTSQSLMDESPYTTARSPPPLANSKYRLAGGLDTPTAAAARREEYFDYDNSMDRNFRRGWSSAADSEDYSSYTIRGLERERNGRGPAQVPMTVTAQEEQESWSRFVFRIAGGLAGKAWEFCRPNAFQGFIAGGGAGDGAGAGGNHEHNIDDQDHDGATKGYRSQSARGYTPVPGRYPVEEDFEEVDYHPSASSTQDFDQQPASKRLQVTQGSGWVVVNHTTTHGNAKSERPTVGLRKSTGFSSSASPSSPLPQPRSRVPRPILQRTTTRTVSLRRPSSRTSSASFATSTSPQTQSQSHLDSLRDPQRQPTPRTASYASPRSSAKPEPYTQRDTSHRSPASRLSTKSTSTHLNTPPSAEAARYAAARAKQERQTDASVRRLNNQLQAMIKQGQEALASRVEVDVDGAGDDVFLDDDGDEVMDENMVDEGYSEGWDEGVGVRKRSGLWRR